MTKLGIISDTHKLLRPEAIEVLEGSDLIIHAGDIGNAEISAGPRRFKLPISLATLHINRDSLEAELHTLRI